MSITLNQNQLQTIIDSLTDLNYHTESLAFQALSLISNSWLNKNQELLEIISKLEANRQGHLKIGHLTDKLSTERNILCFAISQIENIVKERNIKTKKNIEVTQKWLVDVYQDCIT